MVMVAAVYVETGSTGSGYDVDGGLTARRGRERRLESTRAGFAIGNGGCLVRPWIGAVEAVMEHGFGFCDLKGDGLMIGGALVVEVCNGKVDGLVVFVVVKW
ncbi:hypothetical protein M0R45_008904 [Rubus argutus]|uniref:Uncharacterized protein n=1 Tax=Rubus argutus TaxID=59490 RepID=A0AAW1Y5G4_RUBAR